MSQARSKLAPEGPRVTRYQGAIVHKDRLLLIQHREHATGRGVWLLPGGGWEAGETEEECVSREMLEETHLEVIVERLLLDEPDTSDSVYQRKKTYLCRPRGGTAAPGYEPEPEIASKYAIAAVRWVDLRAPSTWGEEVRSDAKTYPELQRIRQLLGYGAS